MTLSCVNHILNYIQVCPSQACDYTVKWYSSKVKSYIAAMYNAMGVFVTLVT